MTGTEYTPKLVSVQDTQDMVAGGKAVLIDVREPDEYAGEHIEGSVNVPMSDFSSQAVKTAAGDKTIIFSCLSGKRAGMMYERFHAETGLDALCMDGCLMGWKAAGLKTVA